MRLNLGQPLAAQRDAAIKQITERARAAHMAHEDAGGFTLAHAAAFGAGSPGASASLRYHAKVQDLRHQAIGRIREAPLGGAIKAIMAEFEAALAQATEEASS